MTKPKAIADDDSGYGRWIEEEWWGLEGTSNDAIAIALGLPPKLASLPGEEPLYGFDVDPVTAQRFLERVDAAKEAVERGDADVVGAAGVDSELPGLLAEIKEEVPAGCQWDVPEDQRCVNGCLMVRVHAPEFIE